VRQYLPTHDGPAQVWFAKDASPSWRIRSTRKSTCFALAPTRPVSRIRNASLALPSGQLRNKKSINLVYVRPGANGQTA
jgi:hypothetical protein